MAERNRIRTLVGYRLVAAGFNGSEIDGRPLGPLEGERGRLLSDQESGTRWRAPIVARWSVRLAGSRAWSSERVSDLRCLVRTYVGLGGGKWL
jgi:hypothetical protein